MLGAAISDKLKAALRDNLKNLDDREQINPWSGDKSTLLLEARAFNENPVNADKCCRLITKILYMLFQGERFSSEDMTAMFFGVTKLFQSSNQRLRRLTYLVIKAMEPGETEAFIVIQCLIKDVNSKSDCNRANAIRVLSKILDATVANQIADRYLKAAIVDRNSFVASSSLACGISLLRLIPDVIRRWVNEVQESVTSSTASGSIVQYHALILLYEMKKVDRLALHKVISSLCKQNLKCPLAECLLIRYATIALTATDRDPAIEKVLMAYIDTCLRTKSKNELVVMEAARAFVQLIIHESKHNDPRCGNVLGFEWTRAIDFLQISLSASKAVTRFAAARTLNSLAQVRPEIVTRCNTDMEPLLSDPNRSTATLALTSLLKTGTESNVERLVKQITSFMGDISDVYKIEVVRAVKALGLQYPMRFKTIMHFLASNLREDGSVDFKRDLVDSLIALITTLPTSLAEKGGPQGQIQGQTAAKEGLLHLCEFIEDCEFSDICLRIVAFMGESVPKQREPAKFVRFLFNRLILENALVRAASADALTKIAMRCPSLRGDIMTLLECGKNDADDEVRDRINTYKISIESAMAMAVEGGGSTSNTGTTAGSNTNSTTKNIVIDPIEEFSVDALYDLCERQMALPDMRAVPIDVSNLPTPQAYQAFKDNEAAAEKERLRAQAQADGVAHLRQSMVNGGGGGINGNNSSTIGMTGTDADSSLSPKMNLSGGLVSSFEDMMGKLAVGLGDPSIMGQIQHTTKPSPVTEIEAEYAVQCAKHMFNEYIVLEFCVTNTLQGVSLSDVSIAINLTAPDIATKFKLVGSVKCDKQKIDYDQTGSAFVVLQKNIQDYGMIVTGSMPVKLMFNQLEEGDDLGFPDETPLENATVVAGDYILPTPLPPGKCKPMWEQLRSQGGEKIVKLQLDFKTLETAVEGVILNMNMSPCEKSQTVDTGRNAHELWLSGTFPGGISVICKSLIGVDAKSGRILMQMIVACKSPEVAAMVASFMQ